MHIICLTPLAPGVYNDHKADHISTLPDGWAYIPEDFPLPSTFPRLGSVEVEELEYVRDVEVLKDVVKTREVRARGENGRPLFDEDGKPVMIVQEYTVPELVTEQRTITRMTVTGMTEGVVPEPEPEPEAVSEGATWDEMAAAIAEGVDEV